MLLGLAIGVATVLGQRSLPGSWNTLANSGAVWLVPVFVIGAFMPTDRMAAATGVLMLAGAVVGYYASVPVIVEGASANSRSVTIWVATALVGGPIFGMAGHWWRGDDDTKRIAALALLGGVFVGEGLDRLLHLNQGAAGWVMVAAGIGTPLVLGRSIKDRLLGLTAELPVAGVTLGAYAIINWAFRA